jgi:hypothetical protein
LSTSRKTPRQMGVRVSSSLDALQQELGESFLCPRVDHAVDRVLLGLTSKAVSLARAICHLVRGGYYAEAFGLSRSSLETFLLAKFISNKKPEERAQSYLDFFKAHYFNREEVRKKYFPRSKAPSGIQKQWIEDASKFPGGTKGWQSAWNMASEILQDPREYNKKTGEPYQALFEFDAMYEHMSHFVHCTSLSTAPHIPRGGEVFKLVDGRIDDPDRGHAALIFAVGYLQMTAILALRQYNHALSGRLDKRLTRLLLEIRTQITPSRIRVRRRRTGSASSRKSAKRNRSQISGAGITAVRTRPRRGKRP